MRLILLAFSKLLGVLVLCFMFQVAFGQANQSTADSIVSTGYFDKAEQFYKNRTYDSASFYYKRAAEGFLTLKSWRRYLKAANYRGDVMQSMLDQNNAAIVWLKQTLKQLPAELMDSVVLANKGLTLISIAYAYRNSGKYFDALEYFDKVIDSSDDISFNRLERVLTGKAVTYWYLGDFDKALATEKTALAALQKNEMADTGRVIIVNNILGLILTDKGNFHEAKDHYKECLRILNLSKRKNYRVFAAVYNNLGRVYNGTEEFEKSKHFYSKAYSIFKTHNFSQRNTAMALNNIGTAHMELGDYTKATTKFTEALDLRLKIFQSDHIHIAQSYFNLGEILKLSGRYKASLPYYRQSLDIRIKNLGLHSDRIARTYGRLGDIYYRLGQYDSALYNLNKGLSSNMLPEEDLSYLNSAVQTFQNSLSTLELLDIMELKAKVFQTKYRLTNDQNFSREAMRLYHMTDSVLDLTRNAYMTYLDKVEFGSVSKNIYEGAITMCDLLYLNTSNEDYLNRAFYFFEKSKTATLLTGMADSRATQISNIPDSLIAEVHQLKIDLSFHQSQEQKELLKSNGYDTVKLDNARRNIFSINRRKQQLVEGFENDYPAYYNHKYNTTTTDINTLHEYLLADDQTFVEYFVGNESSYAFVVSAGGISLKQLPNTDSLPHSIDALYSALRTADYTGYASTAYQLYEQLIAPLGLETSRITIVPDGVLWYLNFDILLTKPSVQKGFKQENYLINKHIIQYAYSATIMERDLTVNINNSPGTKCLAFSYASPSDSQPGSYLTMRDADGVEPESLPGTRREILAIADIIEGEYYFGTQANEKNFKAKANDYEILHLALHGEIDNNNPMSSRLVFSQHADSVEDNYLHAFELYNTELNADLTILSACNSGTGKMANGEGIMSLGRAFTFAGSKSLVISQWELSDEITPELMKTFYTRLADGKNKSDALRDAKLAFLQTSNNLTSNPYYWAALVPIGNDAPMRKSFDRWWVPLGLVVMIGLLYFLKRKKKEV